MSDAEYWIEQRETEAQQGGSGEKEVLCWIDDVAHEVWTWHPSRRVPDLFLSANREAGIGADVFTATAVIGPDDEEALSSELPEHRRASKIGELTFTLPVSDEAPGYEVIVVHRSHISTILEYAERLLKNAKDLKDESIGEMWQAIAEFMQQEEEIESFVFVRTI